MSYTEEKFNSIPPGTYRLYLERGQVDGVVSSDHIFTTFEGEVLLFADMRFLDQPIKVQRLRVDHVQALSLKPDLNDYSTDFGGLLDYLSALVTYESDANSSYPVFLWNLSWHGEWDVETFRTRREAEAFESAQDQRFGYETTGCHSAGYVEEILDIWDDRRVEDQWQAREDFYANCFSPEVHEVVKSLKPFYLEPFKKKD